LRPLNCRKAAVSNRIGVYDSSWLAVETQFRQKRKKKKWRRRRREHERQEDGRKHE
jgi:hypothetical protein